MPIITKRNEVPGYLVQRLIGRGGMAEVYLAKDVKTEEEFALKIMSGNIINDPHFKIRITKEIQVLENLSHNNIVKFFGFGQEKSFFMYMVLEYIQGPDLKKRILSGNVDINRIIRWLNEIADGLDYAHSIGYVHRDIKPENILLRKNDSAVITDFGIAKAMNSSTKVTGTGMSIGTPYYMSPEQARGQKLDYRTDIYSLGIMMYEMLVGQVPFGGADSISIGIMHISKPIPKLPSKFVYWEPLLNKLTAKKREDRYDNLKLFINDLKELEASGKAIISDEEVEKTKSLLSAPPATSASQPQQQFNIEQNSTSSSIDSSLVDEQPLPSSTSSKGRTSSRRSYVSQNTRIRKTSRLTPIIVWTVMVLGLVGLSYIGYILFSQSLEHTADTRSSLLSDAREQVDSGNYFEPSNNNAMNTISGVLLNEPSSSLAWGLLDNMISDYDDITNSEIQRVLIFLRANGNINNVSNTYTSNIFDTLIQRKISQGQLVTPTTSSAVYLVTQAREILPNNTAVNQLYNNVLSQVRQNAQNIASQGNTQGAVDFLSNAQSSGDNTLATANQINQLRASLVANTTTSPPPQQTVTNINNSNNTNSSLTSRLQAPTSSSPSSSRKSLVSPSGGSNTLAQRSATTPSSNVPTSEIERVVNQIIQEMQYIRGGTFKMGNQSGNVDYGEELPVIDVTVGNFYISRFTITFEEYDVFARATGRPLPSDAGWGRGRRPAINISWNDAQDFTRWLTSVTNITFRLPTESEWEYASRAGSDEVYTWGTTFVDGFSNCSDCNTPYSNQTAPVGSFKPNRWGLYDMHGNVWQWVQDCWQGNLSSVPRNGSAANVPDCKERVLRGGSWYNPSDSLRASRRDRSPPSSRSNYDGFRVVMIT